MTTSNTTTLTRKIALGLGAIVVSTMTLAGAADAKSNFNVHLDFGGGGLHGVHFGHGYGPYYGSGWGGPNCWWYLKKYKKTGKFFWKKKFWKCKAKYY